MSEEPDDIGDEMDGSIHEIDPDRIPELWQSQARDYFLAAKNLAKAKLRHAEAKAAYEVAQAEWAKAIRNSPEVYRIKKVTEGAIEAAIVLRPEVRKAHKKVIRRQYEVDIHKADVDAYEHRKKGLEGSTTLLVNGIRAAPRPPRDANGERRRMPEKQVGVKLKKKRRT